MGYALKEQSQGITLGDLGDLPYLLTSPLAVTVAFGESGYTLTEPSSGVFAYHQDLTEALRLLQRALVEQLDFLSSNRANLSPRLQRELVFLQSAISHKK